MSGSFEVLASADVAKTATIDSNAATIVALNKANAELVETNKHLVAQLTTAKLPFSPLGFPSNVPAAPSDPASTWPGLQHLRQACDTSHS